MVKIDQKRHDMYRFREIAYAHMDSLVREENKKGLKFHRGLVGEIEGDTVYCTDSRSAAYSHPIFQIKIEEQNPYEPTLKVYKKDYFEKAMDFAKTIEEDIKALRVDGVEILVKECY